MKFVDIHNHILSGIDDGSKDVEMTIQMLKMASSHHIKKMIVTPHFKEGIFDNTKDIIIDKVEELKLIIQKENLDIEVFPGCEIFLTKNTTSLLVEHKLQTLNNTSYILVETFLAQLNSMFDLKEEIYNLLVDRHKVILAHPERYESIHENPNLVYELCKMGCYMQLNVTSLNEKHRYFKLAKKLLDHDLIHFVSTDAHDTHFRPMVLEHGYEFVRNRYGEERALDLFYHNPLKVIENKEIIHHDYQSFKSKKLFFF